MSYFDYNQSIGYYYQETDEALETIARKYMGSHPAQPYSFRVISADGFKQQSEDGRYILDLENKLPDALFGQYAYAAAKLYIEEAIGAFNLVVNCFGPVTIYLNGNVAFQSESLYEVNRNNKANVKVSLKQGDNYFFFKFKKTLSGFGCIFGAEFDTTHSKNYYSIFAERDGQAGFIYSASTNGDVFKDTLPNVYGSEKNSPVKWYPVMEWNDEKHFQCSKIFGADNGKLAYGYTIFDTGFCKGLQKYTATGSCAGESALWIDQVKVADGIIGDFSIDLNIEYGLHTIIFETQSTDDDFGFKLDILNYNREKCCFVSPYNLKGTDDKWVYLGVFTENKKPLITDLLCKHKVINDTYWRVDMPNAYIRPYVETMRFGRWNYPLGVTLYGMYRTGKLLKNSEIINYAKSHIDIAAKYYEYALWDKAFYGYPSVNHKLIELKMLDDCGSAGSAMLEIYMDNKEEEEYLKIAHDIAGYIKNNLERQPNGAFYRMQRGVHYKTLWADDLYMSVPFLVRYYKITGEKEYLEDAIKQFLLFKKYLFIDDKKLMSHVYDFKFNTANKLPWGRANGWVIFSLTELLEKMPKDHVHRDEIVTFFREMSLGILDVQGENGLWHQLLIDPTSFEEASCTSMFAYAFARGIRLGLYNEADLEKYYLAAKKAWKGLRDRAVDKEGNVYGVCCGSRYGFHPEYYTKELHWVKNDYHGIGIVMLAGIELKNLDAFFKL